jgi:RND family efflux transporter MFP subunit
MKETMRRLTPLLALALLPVGCTKDSDAIALPRTQGTPTTPAKGAQPATTTAQAPVTPVVNPTVTGGTGIFTGTTRPARASNLAPQVSGMLLKVMVKEGDNVRKGQALVQLEPSDFRLAIRHANAARHTARTQLAAVKIEYQRLQGLLQAKAIPTSQFDKVDAQFKLAQAGVAMAEVAVSRARASMAKTVIRAPYSAVVTRKMLDEGAYATVMPPSPVVRVEELDRLEVHVNVPEGDMKRVQKGTPVTLHFRAVTKTIQAKIDRIVPSLSPQTRSFLAIVLLPNPKHELRPGMYVEVRMGSGAGR